MTETLVCRRCGTPNRPGIAYCANCGQRLVRVEEATMVRPGATADSAPCPRCGAPNRVGAAFCSECGFNIRPAVPSGPATGAIVAGPSSPAASATAPAAGPAAGGQVRAWLGPIVLTIAAAGLLTAWFLPFSVGGAALADQALGPDGFRFAFWTGLPADAGVLEAAYFAVAAPLPVLVALLIALAVVGVPWGSPGRGQRLALSLALLWCLAFATLFVVVEIGSGLGGGLIDLLRGLSPAGLIGFLSGAIGAIGATTRLAGG